MKKAQKSNLSSLRIIAILIVFIGLGLMSYMIMVEDEPGAIPLFLIFSGIISLIVIQIKYKKQIH